MYLDFKPSILQSNLIDLAAVWALVANELERLQNIGARRFAYVSGPSLHCGKAAENMGRLDYYTQYVGRNFTFPVFSASSLFDSRVAGQIDSPVFTDAVMWMDFWHMVLQHGKVTDIVMIPGWEESIQSREERCAAAHLGVRCFEVNPDADVIVPMR